MRRYIVAAVSTLALSASSAGLAQSSGANSSAQKPPAAAAPSATAQQSGGSQGAKTNEQASRPDARISVILIAPVAASVQPVSQDALYKGFRASELKGQDVYGPKGNQLGEVQEILVNKDGQITSIVVEGGGFLELGDAAFRIPFDQLDLTPGKDGVVAKNMTETKAEDLGLFDGPETVLTGPREFRVGELTGDWALLRNGMGYGNVRDVVFSREGKAIAVLVNRDVRQGAGLYAYPFYGYSAGWDPALSYYALPFDSLAMAANAPKVDSKRFESGTL